MPNIPIVAFDSVEQLGSKNGTAAFSPDSGENSFDSFLEDAGNSLEDVHSETTSASREADKSESSNSPSAETDHSDEEVQASTGDNQGDSGQVENSEDSEDSEPISSTEGQGESDGQGQPDDGQPVNLDENVPEAGLMNLIPGGKLPFPHLVNVADGEGFDGQSIGVALVSEKSGLTVLGNGNSSPASVKAAGGAPGANALRRQLELMEGVMGRGEGAQNESGSENPGNRGAGVINAKENVPAVMPKTSSFGEMSGDEENSAGMMPGKSASSANNSQNANPKATPLNGQEVPELPVTPIDGESIATSVTSVTSAASGDAVAVSEDVDADDASRPVSTNKDPAGAISKASGGSDAQTDSGAEFGSGTAQDNDASELFRAQFTQTGNGGVEFGAAEEGDPIASGRDTAINSLESLLAKSGPEFISAEAKGNSEIQATAKDQQVVSPLRARVQEQVLETVVARVSLAIRDKVSHARIRLDPPSLGRVDMQLRVEDGSLTAKVTVESAWVKDAITANLKELHDALEEHGVKVEEFTVDVDSGMDSRGSDQAFDGDEADGALYLESNSLEEEDTDSTLAGADSFSSDADGDSSTLDLFA